MVELVVRSKDGAPIDKVSVDPAEFGGKVKVRLMHEAVILTEQNGRLGTVNTRDRSMVAGANRKPWRQKGTGRARHGTHKSPIWRQGGVVHGPKPHSYKVRMPKQARRSALRSAFLAKLLDNEVLVVSDLAFPQPKTKEAAKVISALGLGSESVLVVTPQHDPAAYRSLRNIPTVSVRSVRELCCYDVLRHRRILLTKDALDELRKAPPARAASRKRKGV